MGPADFKKLFSNFSRLSDPIIQANLALAAIEMGGPDFSVWPAFATLGPNGQANQTLSIGDLAHGNLTAHLLQTSPQGGMTRLEPESTNGRSVYGDKYDDLSRAVANGPVVAGSFGSGLTSPQQGALALQPGSGFASVTNGSTAVGFTVPQTLKAGTVLAFVGSQAGALYVLHADIVGSTSGVLSAQYTGITAASTAWNYGAG